MVLKGLVTYKAFLLHHVFYLCAIHTDVQKNFFPQSSVILYVYILNFIIL